MNLSRFRGAPFHLDTKALAWVGEQFAALSPARRRAQLLIPLCQDDSAENLSRYASLGIGGLFLPVERPLARLRQAAGSFQGLSALPALVCGDLEYGELGAVGGASGTAFPNQHAAAAAGAAWPARMARLAAAEGRAAGFHWSFSPVADLDLHPECPVVGTRSFGDRTEKVSAAVCSYLRALQAGGLAACAKHWPGDGVDSLDQHYATSVNHLPMAEWERRYGRIYRAAIRAGVLTVMSAHIALPAFPGAGKSPASLSRQLNETLLRGRLGFRGLIVSDASGMAGLNSQGPRERIIPQLIANGCDMLLFPVDVELELDYLARAQRDGRLSQARVDEAVLRVLALKAALGLHRRATPPAPLSKTVLARHARSARDCAAAALTLVRDPRGLLPLSPARTPRILLIQQRQRRNFFSTLPELQLERLLRAEGFQVECLGEEADLSPERFDLAIYATAEESHACKTSLRVDWQALHSPGLHCMARLWHCLPCLFVSFGTPRQRREIPESVAYIDAYSPIPASQEALVRALLGRHPFTGKSPVSV